MINWKVVVGSGAVAVVLSLLTGIISGVSFGTLLLRAIMWGALFCGAGAGGSFLVSKYLPELFAVATETESEADGEAPETRQNVDIVLPDENPHVADPGEESTFDLFGDVDESESSGEAEEVSGAETGADRSAANREETMVEEVEEIHRERGGPGEPFIPSKRGGNEVETAEELPDLEGEEGDISSSAAQAGFQPQGISDISNISGRGSKIDVMGHTTDTEEIAKAIRTALKKDEKG
jgi:hypothetical protein